MCDASEGSLELGVAWDVGLVVDEDVVGVDATGEVEFEGVEGVLAEGAVLDFVEGVHIGYEEEFFCFGVGDAHLVKWFDGTKIVSEVELVARDLEACEDSHRLVRNIIKD